MLVNGMGSKDIVEVARTAKLGAKLGQKWCGDILLLSIACTREERPSIIRDAPIESLFEK